MKAKYMKQYVLKIFFFFCKFIGWNLAILLRINFFTDNFQGFWLKEHLSMATSRFCTKCLKRTRGRTMVYAGWNPVTCAWNKQSLSLLNRMPIVTTCQSGTLATVLACQHGLRTIVPAASAIYVPTWMRANVPFGVPMLQLGAWCANVPNDVPIFQFGKPTCQKAYQFFKHSFYEMLRKISILYY